MKRKNLLLTMIAIPLFLYGGHCYALHLVNSVITHQIETNKEPLKAEMTDEIINSLERDEQLKQQVASLLRDAVTKELEENGEQHIRRIIKEKYPMLEAFLAAQEQDTD